MINISINPDVVYRYIEIYVVACFFTACATGLWSVIWYCLHCDNLFKMTLKRFLLCLVIFFFPCRELAFKEIAEKMCNDQMQANKLDKDFHICKYDYKTNTITIKKDLEAIKEHQESLKAKEAAKPKVIIENQ